jgi:hypothetical protein
MDDRSLRNEPRLAMGQVVAKHPLRVGQSRRFSFFGSDSRIRQAPVADMCNSALALGSAA